MCLGWLQGQEEEEEEEEEKEEGEWEIDCSGNSHE